MIRGQRFGNLGASLRTANFEIVSGVAKSSGGDAEGPSPHELLEASLAACTVITVQMYANHKQWPLKSVNVSVHIDEETSTGTKMSREIQFEGDLSEEQRTRLLEIAEKCPLHRILSHPIQISTRAVDSFASVQK